MKRLIILFVFLSLLFTYCGKTLPPNQRYVITKFLIGEVFTKQTEKDQWQKLTIGKRLSIHNLIQTKENSQCDIQLMQTGTIRIKGNTTIQLSDLFYDKKTGIEKTKLKMKNGTVLVKIKKLLKEKKDSEFNMETPTTVVGVRGTEFLVSANEKNDTHIAVNTGKVAAKPNVTIKEGEKISEELKTIINKDIIITSKKEIHINKKTVDDIKKIVQENIKSADNKQTSDIQRIINKNINVKTIKKSSQESLKEFDEIDIEEEIEEKKGKLIIDIDPVGARFSINNKEKGVTPGSLLLKTGEKISIKIKKEGYNELIKEITINEGENILKEILKKKAKKGDIIWKYKSSSGIKNDIASTKDKIIFSGNDGTVTCINTESKLLWNYKIPSGISSSPVISGFYAFVGGNDGILYALNITEGNVKWKKNIGTIVYSKPYILRNKVYVGTSKGNLVVLNKATGAVIWQYKSTSGIYSTPVVKDDTVYFGCEDSNLYALDNTGKLKWSFKTGSRIVKSAPAVFQNNVLIGSYDGMLYCINTQDGTLTWQFQSGNKILSTPSVYNGTVFLSSTSGNLYGINIKNGKKIWNKKIGNKLESSPIVMSGNVYIGSDNGNVYAFTRNGKLMWKSKTDGTISGTVSVTGSILLAGTEKKHLLAISR